MKNKIWKILFMASILTLCYLYAPSIYAEELQGQPQPGWHYENGAFTYYMMDNGSVEKFSQTGVIQFTNETTYQTANKSTVFKAGYYYFTAGNLKLSTSNVLNLPVYKADSNACLTQLGVKMIQNIPADKSKTTIETIVVSKSKLFTGIKNQKAYAKGDLYSGPAKIDNKYYSVSKGVVGKAYNGFLKTTYLDADNQKLCSGNQKLYKNGVGFTGIYEKTYYEKGFPSEFTGWKKYDKNIYYFSKGKAVTGTKYIKSYGGGSHKYRYTFRKDGTLMTNLFTQGNGSVNYYKQKMKFEVNITTHTITILMYDKTTGGYDIPLKAFVCSTAKNGRGTKTGNHHLAKGSRCRWFIVKGNHFYQYGVFIKGSYSWFHSEYYTQKNIRKLSVRIYNGLGTNQTSACVRTQVINAKLIYDIAGQNPYDIPVQIFRSSLKGAFGQVTINDVGGKLPSWHTYDPTDPGIK